MTEERGEYQVVPDAVRHALTMVLLHGWGRVTVTVREGRVTVVEVTTTHTPVEDDKEKVLSS